MAEIYEGSVGIKITIRTNIDISLAKIISILYKKPNKQTGKWIAILEGTQSAYYITSESDLSIAGNWFIQLYVEIDNSKLYGSINDFKVAKSVK